MHNLPTLLAAAVPLLILAFFNRWAVVAGISGLLLAVSPIVIVLSAAGQGDSGSPAMILFFGALLMVVCLAVFLYTRRKVSHGWALLGAIAWTVSGIIVFGI